MNKRKQRHLKRMEAKHGTPVKSPDGKWGLLDTKDDLWMGDSAGPVRYNEEIMAQIAARILDYQVGYPAGRIRARLFTSATKKVDDIPVIRTAECALELIESGRVL